MPGTSFIGQFVPFTIDEMNALLKECTPDDMSPLNKCLIGRKEQREGNQLKFKDFLNAIAYPIQSYKVTKDSKYELFSHVKRLYPKLEVADAKKFQVILSRMQPDGRPAFDNLESYEDLPVSAIYTDAFLGVARESSRVMGSIELASKQLNVRWAFLLEQCNLAQGSQKELAETYQSILNLLYLESQRVRQSFNWAKFAAATTALYDEYYRQSEKVVLLSPTMEIDTCPAWNDQSEDDFAFAIQRQGLLLQIVALSSHSEKKHRKELVQIYQGLLECSAGSVNPRISHFLAFLRKEVAFYKLKEITRECLNFDKEYNENQALDNFARKVVEDYFAPCNRALLNIDLQFSAAQLNVAQEYNTIYKARAQQIKDTRAVCEFYSSIVGPQVELYAHVYQLLKDLVSKQKQKHKPDWMQYFKIFIKTAEHQHTLPEQLPVFPLEEFDARAEILKELQKQVPQVWPVSLPPVQKEQVKKKPKSAKRAAFPLATELASDSAPVTLDDEEAGESADAASSIALPLYVPENVPMAVTDQALPTPFQYANRVLRWFKAKVPLDPAIFPEYRDTLSAYQQLMIVYHAFTCSVDSFVIKLALELPWINPKTNQAETRYVLPAEILVPQLGSKKRGVITYCIGQGNKVYHRFFSERTTEQVVRDVSEQAFKETDFPSLAQAVDENMSRVEVLSSKDSAEKIVTHPFWRTVKITNVAGVEVTLYPVKPQ